MIKPTSDKTVFHTTFSELLNDHDKDEIKHIKVHEPLPYEKNVWIIAQDAVLDYDNANNFILVKSMEYGNGVTVGFSMKRCGIIDRASLLCADKVDYIGNREPIEVPEFTAVRVR